MTLDQRGFGAASPRTLFSKKRVWVSAWLKPSPDTRPEEFRSGPEGLSLVRLFRGLNAPAPSAIPGRWAIAGAGIRRGFAAYFVLEKMGAGFGMAEAQALLQGQGSACLESFRSGPEGLSLVRLFRGLKAPAPSAIPGSWAVVGARIHRGYAAYFVFEKTGPGFGLAEAKPCYKARGVLASNRFDPGLKASVSCDFSGALRPLLPPRFPGDGRLRARGFIAASPRTLFLKKTGSGCGASELAP